MVQVPQTGNASGGQQLLVPFRFLHTGLIIFSSIIPFLLIGGILIFLSDIFQAVLVFGVGLIIALLIGLLTARPLAISRYLKAVRKEQEVYSRLYTPLAALKDVYETPVRYREAGVAQNKQEDITDLMQVEDTHLLILGLPGAGKTMALRACLEKVLQKSRGNARIPLYVPMKDYNAYLINNQRAFLGSTRLDPVETLLDYALHGSDLKEMRYLQPYLRSLLQRGRMLLLCDGLNELNSGLLEFVCGGLLRLMETTQNRLIMTCRELDYREQPVLQQLIGPGRADEALIAPLPLDKITEFVQRYHKILSADGQPWNYSAEEMSELIKRTSLRYDCANPFMLVTLIKTIRGIEPGRGRRIDTRGLLLQVYVTQALESELKQEKWRGSALQGEDVLLFLSNVAFTMRRVKYRNAVRLGSMSATSAEGSNRAISPEELANRLLRWLEEPDPDAPRPLLTELDLGLEPLHRPYSRPDIVQFLTCATDARVVTISQNGVLSFQHELIAEYFAAEYLHRLHEKNPTVVPFGQELFDEVGSWSEPVAIWGGLVPNPLKLAEHLASWESRGVSSLYNVLVLSLVCAGVAWRLQPTAPSVQRFPANILDILRLFIPNEEARKKLATIFKRCADEGGAGIYRALLPLLSEMEGTADLLLLLDRPVIAELLIDYLVEVADKTAYRDQVEHLKDVLGRLGEPMIPQIAQLSRAEEGHNRDVRAAALDILGRIGSANCVELLVPYLGDDDEEVILPAAVNALRHLGPEVALEPVAGELANTAPRPRREQIHWGALNVLQGFLARPALPEYLYQPTINAVVTVLSASYVPQAQQKARDMLLSQLGPYARREKRQQEIVIQSLIGSLRTPDAVRVGNALDVLGHAGSMVTPYLLHELKSPSSETVRTRLITALGTVRDARALPDLIALLADPSASVQQELAQALQRYAPDSIVPLVDVVLSTQVADVVVERASTLVGAIGEDANQAIRDATIQAICAALPRVVARGTHHLILILQTLRDTRAVPPLIALLKQVAPTHAELGCDAIHALGVLRDVLAIAPIIDILAHFSPPLADCASEALGSFGELALDALVAALDVKKEVVFARRIRDTLLRMQPFPRQHLLEAFKQATAMQAEQLMIVFQGQATEVAPFLVDQLFNPDQRVQQYVRRMVTDMPGSATIPPLIEALDRQGKWQMVLANYLLRYPEAIPALVARLGEEDRGPAAYAILFKFGERVLPSLMAGLDSDRALRRTRELLVALVRQNQANMPRVVSLFDPAVSHLAELTERMQKQLHSILVQELADICLPALLQGLEDHRLIGNVSDVLASLVHFSNQRDSVLQAVFDALHEEPRRQGAEITLIKIGAPALPGLGERMIDPEPAIAQSAQFVLREMGPLALPLISTAYRDTSNPLRQGIALQIFKAMPTSAIAQRLVTSLRSEEQREVEMALALLHLRLTDEARRTFDKQQEIVPALLLEAQQASDYQHILAALILLDEKTMGRGRIASYLADFLLNHAEQSPAIMPLFSVLGDQAAGPLAELLDKTDTLSALHRDTASVLGTISRDERVLRYVHELASYVRPKQQTLQFNDPRRRLYLRAFGGLLANEKLGIDYLERLRIDSNASAEREFFEVLLGFRNMPEVETLKEKLETIERNLAQEQRSAQERQQEIEWLKRTLAQLRTEKGEIEGQLQATQNSLAQARQQITYLQARR